MIIFAISIALQLTGAVFLIEIFNPSRKAVLKRAFDETGNVIWNDFYHAEKNLLTKERLQRNAQKAYQGFYAIILISAGYVLTPIGKHEDILTEILIIIGVGIVLYCPAKTLIKYLAEKNYTENAIVDKVGNEIEGNEADEALQGE